MSQLLAIMNATVLSRPNYLGGHPFSGGKMLSPGGPVPFAGNRIHFPHPPEESELNICEKNRSHH
jgi:hypothetical protein